MFHIERPTIKAVDWLRNWNVGAALKLLLLFFVYPAISWFCLNAAAARASAITATPNPLNVLLFPLLITIYFVTGVGLLFVIAVPLWSIQARKHPQSLHASFRLGLYAASVALAIIGPAQGLLLGLAILVASLDSWIWSILAAGGAIAATIVLLNHGLRNEPGVYMTLRAQRINPADHPRLHNELIALSQDLGIPLPPHILVGLQPELLGSTATVFCPDGELNGGVLCLSLPASNLLSIAEFRALAGEALVQIQAALHDNRTQFFSINEGANDAVRNLNETMKEWSWVPRVMIHPYFILFWIIAVAAMRFPLYLGKEWLTFYLKSAWTSREILDAHSSLSAYSKSAQDVGAVPAITAMAKEAAISLAPTFWQLTDQEESHPLIGIAALALQQHPGLTLDSHRWKWNDLASAWKHLQFRCQLAGKNLDWCVNLARDVSPVQPAASLFENTAALNTRLVNLLKQQFVIAKSQAG